MKPIFEFLSTKVKQSIIKADNSNIRKIVKSELDHLGDEADLNHIDVSDVTNMAGLFAAKNNEPAFPVRLGLKYTYINPDVSNWDVSNVITMDSMFLHCKKFNCDISQWNVGKVENMQYMFCECYEFNQDLSKWDVSSCCYMQGMFSYAESFNSDIHKWDTSNVITMRYMFNKAKSFKYNISNWNVNSVLYRNQMFTSCPLEKKKRPEFYNALDYA